MAHDTDNINDLKMAKLDDLIQQLELYDDAYEIGSPLVPDTQYDLLKTEAQKKSPNHPYFMKVGSDVRGGKVKLPYTMGSLNQIYEGDYIAWCAKFNLYDEEIAISDKLDGVSCMLQYKNGELQIAYSRGNGVLGADITRHIKKIKNVPQTIDYDGHITIRGEVIMPVELFEKNWADEYANPRNLTAGVLNRKLSDSAELNDLVFIAYQIVEASDQSNSQNNSMKSLDTLKFQTVKSRTYLGKDLSDTVLSSILADCRKESDYELDGIVLTINKQSSQKSLSNSSSLNPEHSVKYKVLDASAIVTATVVKVHYEISKNGYFKPRVEILPIKLGGVTITYATGFNGKYIIDNQIGPGTTINLVRSGQVIPYILNTITSSYAEIPSEPWEWNENKVEMVVKDAQNHPDVIFKQVLDFFNTLEVDLLKEASIRNVITSLKLTDQSYETIIQTMLSIIELEWVSIIGSNGTKIFASLERKLNNLTLATYFGAVKYFGHGFGVRKAKLLLKNLTTESDVWQLKASQIEDYDGFDTKTADRFVGGIYDAWKLATDLGLQFVQETKTNELEHLHVVFTGFRDKEFQAKLEKSGAKVGSSVSKNSTHVITAEPNSTSGKAVKARQLGIETLSLDEFKEQYNL
jgi:DNA ligase (NAD+)